MKKYLLLIAVILLTISITYILVPRPYMVHWHANFAVYTDGKQKDFSGTGYMEETSRCNITTDVKPQDRIHLHDNKGGLVHVHMAASTWGDLFNNLGWGIGRGYLADLFGKISQETPEKHLYFFINGVPTENPANEVVKSTDRLLVWYGTGSREEVQSRWATLVSSDADEYNHKSDPASCGSNTYGILDPIATPIHEWIEHIFEKE